MSQQIYTKSPPPRAIIHLCALWFGLVCIVVLAGWIIYWIYDSSYVASYPIVTAVFSLTAVVTGMAFVFLRRIPLFRLTLGDEVVSLEWNGRRQTAYDDIIHLQARR